MTPFGGEGANLAMLDGAELALAIASVLSPDSQSSDSLDSVVTRYEQKMFTRGSAMAADSDLTMREFISENGVVRGLAHIRREIARGPPGGDS